MTATRLCPTQAEFTALSESVDAKVRKANLENSSSVTFPINSSCTYLIACNHPYNANGGLYLITGGYTTSANVTTIKSSSCISSITKPTSSSVKITSSASTFVTIIGL